MAAEPANQVVHLRERLAECGGGLIGPMAIFLDQFLHVAFDVLGEARGSAWRSDGARCPL
jgi:hypothetical protein